MSNWDLMMPGMGLTAIGLAGVTISYAGVAHTFIDGMHALTGLTMFIGLIFLSAGILEGGVSTSNRAKATTLVILGISFSFAVAALTFNNVTSIPTFAGVMLIVIIPAIVMAYVSMKMPQYFKPIAIIFVLAVGAAVGSYVGFGLYGPSQYLVPPPIEEEAIIEPVAPTAPIFAISILKGSAAQGNPDYDPDAAQVPAGNIIEWTNNDDVSHTATSTASPPAFDSSLINAGAKFTLDTSKLSPGTYDYLCIVHPWMTASFEIIQEGAEPSPERLAEGATVTDPNSIPQEEVEEIETPAEEIEESEMVEEEMVEEQITEEPTPTETEESASEVIVQMAKGSGSDTECGDECFIPSNAVIPIGGTITWENVDSVGHTATEPNGVFDTGFLNAGGTYSRTFEAAGTLEYICIVHPWMKGTITIG